MNTLDNLTERTRRGLCLVMAALIVSFSLTLGSMGADAAFADAYAQAMTTHAPVMQLASL